MSIDHLKDQLQAIADLIEQASGASFRPTGHLASALRHATNADTPAFASMSLETGEGSAGRDGTVVLFTEQFVAVADVTNAPDARGWSSEQGPVTISVTRRSELRSLALEVEAPGDMRQASLAFYEEFPWRSTIVATYEGLPTPVRILNGQTRLDVGAFYSELVQDLASK
ncbi:hypothetical protein [Cellulosimicrobium cellulans]|uniref:hypothetical protein n=1 Tax=Cellulosimicrobium cellulans TaxID=1710 RepID=UPI000848BC30|nr:hypothetical protein [Cellulosimicrobium cellulans]